MQYYSQVMTYKLGFLHNCLPGRFQGLLQGPLHKSLGHANDDGYIVWVN